MKKQIFLFLVLFTVAICMTTCQPAFAQSGSEIQNQTSEPIIPRRSFRIVFEGTFQSKRSENYNQQGIIPGDYINTSPGNYFPRNDSMLSTNPFSQDYSLSPSYGYGSMSGLKNILLGFDANFVRSNGRHFVVSSRTSFTSYSDKNPSTKETWLKLHTEGKKPSSLVVNFTIRIIR